MSLSQHLAKVLEVNGKKSIFSLIFSFEGLKFFADGNIGYNKLVKGPTAGKLVGSDKYGNRYYENDDLSYTRRRWVVYGDTFDYNASSISPEWHGWINYINDYNPSNYKFNPPKYAVESYITRTGTSEAYQPKGSWHNPQQRTWRKVETWTPPTPKS